MSVSNQPTVKLGFLSNLKWWQATIMIAVILGAAGWAASQGVNVSVNVDLQARVEAIENRLDIPVNSSLSAFLKSNTYIISTVDTYATLLNGTNGRLVEFLTNQSQVFMDGLNNASVLGGSVYVFGDAYSAVVIIPNNVRFVIDKGATGINYTVASGANCIVDDFNSGTFQYYSNGLRYSVFNYAMGNLLTQSANLTTIYVNTITSLTGNLQILKLVVESGPSFPPNPTPGRLFYNNASNVLFYYNSTTWVSGGSGGGGGGTYDYNQLFNKPDLSQYLFENGTRPLTANWNLGGSYGIYGATLLNTTSLYVTGAAIANSFNSTTYYVGAVNVTGNMLTGGGSWQESWNTTVAQLITNSAIAWTQITGANATVQQLVSLYQNFSWQNSWNATVSDIILNTAISWSEITNANTTVNQLIAASTIAWSQISNANATVQQLQDKSWQGAWNATVAQLVAQYQSFAWQGAWNSTVVQLASSLTNLYASGWVNSTSINGNNYYLGNQSLGFVEPPTFILDVSGTSYRAWYGTNSTLAFQGTNASAVINNVFGNSSGNTVGLVTLKGTFILTNPLVPLNNIYVDSLQANVSEAAGSVCSLISTSYQSHITIDGGYWDANGVNNAASNTTNGFTFLHCSDITVKNLVLVNARHYGVDFDYTVRGSVLNSNISQTFTECGIEVEENSTDSLVQGNYVSNCSFLTGYAGDKSSLDNAGIATDTNDSGTTMTDNWLYGSDAGISVHNVHYAGDISQQITVTDNHLFNQLDKGIDLRGLSTGTFATQNIFSDNVIVNAANYSIEGSYVNFTDFHDNQIYNNLGTASSQCAIYFYNAYFNNIHDNTINTAAYGGIDLQNAYNNTLDYNTIANAPRGFRIDTGCNYNIITENTILTTPATYGLSIASGDTGNIYEWNTHLGTISDSGTGSIIQNNHGAMPLQVVSPLWNAGTNTQTGTINRTFLAPIYFPSSGTITQFDFSLQAGSAGTTIIACLYADSGSLTPAGGSLLWNASASASSAFNITLTCSVKVKQGWYWFGLTTQDATVAFYRFAANAYFGGVGGYPMMDGCYFANTLFPTNGLPTSCPTVSTSANARIEFQAIFQPS